MKSSRMLDYQETSFFWSPKLNVPTRVVGVQLALSEVAESDPDIVEYSFPGPDLAIQKMEGTRHRVRMTAKWRNGVTGAIDYLTEPQVRDGLESRIRAYAESINLKILIIDQSYLSKHSKHYSSWRQLVRYLHPLLRPETWGISDELQSREWPKERMDLDDVARVTKVDPQTTLVAVARLIHRGVMNFDSDRGTYDLSSKIWRT